MLLRFKPRQTELETKVEFEIKILFTWWSLEKFHDVLIVYQCDRKKDFKKCLMLMLKYSSKFIDSFELNIAGNKFWYLFVQLSRERERDSVEYRVAMRGFVNYYIDEEEENYKVLRGEKDIYKFKLSQTEIELRDPTKEEIPLEFQRDGIIFTDHVTRVHLTSDFNQTKKISYEKELDNLLRTKLGNVCEIQFFDHNIR